MSESKSRTWRGIVFGCLGLLLLGCVIVAGLAAFNWGTLDSFIFIMSDLEAAQVQPRVADDLLIYLEKYPDDSALVLYSVYEDGTIDTGDTAIVHNGDMVVPLASTVKIVLLGSYAQAVVAGEIDPDRPVSMAEWERYYLPGSDGGAHIASLNELGIEHEAGLAQDPELTVTVADLVNAMIRYSDNAATDFIFNELGEAAIERFVIDANLQGQGPFFNLSGYFLSWQNHDQSRLSGRRAAELAALSQADFLQEMARWDELMADTEWRQVEHEWRVDGAPAMSLREQYVVSQLAPAGTANDYAMMMAGVVTDQLISAEVSTLMRSYLDWPMEFESNVMAFSDFGTKGGSLPGISTEASYMVPLEGDFAGQPRVAVLFLNEMPGVPFGTMAQSFAGQAFMRQLVTDANFAAETAAVLGIHP